MSKSLVQMEREASDQKEILLKSFWCPKHILPHKRHKIQVYASSENRRSPRKGEATKIYMRVK